MRSETSFIRLPWWLRTFQAIPFVAIGGLIALSGCAVLMKSGWLPPSPKSFETHHYSHALHLNEVGLNCDYCHASVWEAVDDSQKHTPKMKVCLQCHYHKQQFNQDDCANCHIVPEAEIPRVHADLHFSHKQHLALPGMEDACEVCHTTNRTSTRMADRNIPSMQVCLNCHYHEDQYQNLLCLNCHTDMGSAGLKPLSRFSHQGDFLRDHKFYTWSQANLCAQCHTTEYCMECHADNSDELAANMKWHGRTDVQFVHGADYLSRHFIEARNDPAMCITCHRPSYCETCHREHGVSDIIGRNQVRTSPHPRDFANERSPNFHGRIARREIVSCAGCHDQGQDAICVECHSLETDAINPHPKGWTSDKDMNSDRPCIYCHTNAAR